MLDPMDVIGPLGDRLLALAKRLQAETPLGQPINTASPAYKEFLRAMEDAKATLIHTEGEMDRQAASELGELQAGFRAQKEAQAAAAASPAPPEVSKEGPPGSIAHAFAQAHKPGPTRLEAAIHQLLRRPLGPALPTPAPSDPGSVWSQLHSKAEPPRQPAPQATPAPDPPATPLNDPGSVWSQWIVSPSPPPPDEQDQSDAADWGSV